MNLIGLDTFTKIVGEHRQSVKKIFLGNASVEDGNRLCEIVTRHFYRTSIGCVSKSLVSRFGASNRLAEEWLIGEAKHHMKTKAESKTLTWSWKTE